MPEAAEMLYDILNNVNMLDRQTPILVACNKQDDPFARKTIFMTQQLERELEDLRKVRRAQQDDQDTAREQVAKAGFLEQIKTKFSFTDAQLKSQLPPVTFCECSIKNEELGQVYRFI